MTRHDPYPSRTGGRAQMLPRKDPVVCSTRSSEGPLSPSGIEAFERDGFLVIDGFFDPAETRSLQQEASRLPETLADSRAPEVIFEPGGGAVRSVFAIHRSSTTFAKLVTTSRLVEAVMQILGSEVYVHQSRINYKPAFRGREFYWHSDFETWHVEDGMPRMRAVSVSLNLRENSAHNGPLMLVPGSHKHYISCEGHTPERNYEKSLREQVCGVPEMSILEDLVERGGIVAPLGPPGSVVLFDCNTMHGSNGNITPWPRSNVFLVYNSVENALEAPYSGQQPRPEYIASRDFTPIPAGA